MIKPEASDLTIERGLFVFDQTHPPRRVECDLDTYNSQIFDHVKEICKLNNWQDNMPVYVYRQDGSVCYCYCVGPVNPSTETLLPAAVERGFFVLDKATLSEFPYCDPIFCGSISEELFRMCDQKWEIPEKVIVMKPDGTVCFCRCF